MVLVLAPPITWKPAILSVRLMDDGPRPQVLAHQFV